MPRPRTTTSVNANRTAGVTILGADRVKKINDAAVSEVKKRLGLSVTPAAVDRQVKEALESAIAAHVNQAVVDTAQQAVRGELGGSLPRIESQVVQLKTLATSSSVKASFEQQAKLHRQKYEAYKAAGFSDDQSFRLLELEIRARAERGF